MAKLTNQNFKVIGSAFLIKIKINTHINKVNCYLLLKAFPCLSQQAQSQQNWYNYVMNSFELRKIPNNCLQAKSISLCNLLLVMEKEVPICVQCTSILILTAITLWIKLILNKYIFHNKS